MWHKVNFKGILTGLTLEFYLSTGYHTKVKYTSLLYYWLIVEESIIGFMLLQKV